MGWLIALGVLVLVGFIRIGIQARYDADGPLIRLILGPVNLQLVPGKKKTGKEDKNKTDKPAKKAKSGIENKLPTQPPDEPKIQEKKSGGALTDFLPLVRVALDFLGDFITRIRFQDLFLKLILAGDDPCDLAVNYGRAWAALGNLGPALDNVLNIKKRDLEIQCDFEARETLVSAGVDITITIGRTLYLLVRYGYRAVKEYIKLKNKRKGGAVK